MWICRRWQHITDVCVAVADAAGHTLQVPVEVSSVEVGDNMIPVPTRRATMPNFPVPARRTVFLDPVVAGSVHQMTSQPPATEATVEPAAVVSVTELTDTTPIAQIPVVMNSRAVVSDTENGISSFIPNSCKTKYISRPSGGGSSHE